MPAQEQPTSPVERAQEAKRARDLPSEMSALIQGYEGLKAAPWSPTQVGDHLVVTFEALEDVPGFTETYEVVPSGSERWPDQTELRLVGHNSTQAEWAGRFAGPPEFSDDDAIETAWMEAGPDRLAVLRGGKVLHQGRHALLTETASSPAPFFQEGRTYSTPQDGYTAPEDLWAFDCRHVTKTPTGDPIAFGFVRVGTEESWTPTGFGNSDWDRGPWTAS